MHDRRFIKIIDETAMLLHRLFYYKKEDIMEALFFLLGLVLGGTLGIITMCLFQINKNKRDLD